MLESACANCVGRGLPIRAESDAVKKIGIGIGHLTVVRRSARQEEGMRTTLRAGNTTSLGPSDGAGGMKMIAKRTKIVKVLQGLMDDIAMTSGAQKDRVGSPPDTDHPGTLRSIGVRHLAGQGRRMCRSGIEMTTRTTSREGEMMIVLGMITLRNQNRAKIHIARIMNPTPWKTS